MIENSMKEFVNKLSSSAPVPGGGGASAYAAALGMALGEMVANLTTGKKKYAQYQKEIEELIKKSELVTDELMEYMDKDAQAFEPLSKAYGLPKETDEQRKYKEQVMETALLDASLVPIELMEKIIESICILERLSVIGTRIAISDVGVGVQMALAALNGASLNVYINTGLMKNREKAAELDARADELVMRGKNTADKVFEAVKKSIRKQE